MKEYNSHKDTKTQSNTKNFYYMKTLVYLGAFVSWWLNTMEEEP